MEQRPCLDPEETLHNCLTPTDHLLTPCDNLSETPLTNADFSWLTDGSYLKDENGRYCAGYAIATPFEVIATTPLPLATSAQQAELDALLKLVPWPRVKPQTFIPIVSTPLG